MAYMIRYVTKWDGTPRTLENIRFVLSVLSYDNRYTVSMDEYEDLHIETGSNHGMVAPIFAKGTDVIIWQDGTIQIEVNGKKYDI